MLIDLNQASQGKSNRKFADVDSFIDYFLVRTEQNKEKGYTDLSVINGVRQLETASESSLLSKITLYE
jgi:DNA-binding MltR family transcriptional regulator